MGLDLVGVVSGQRVELGVERHLRIDDHGPAAGQPHHQVGSVVSVLVHQVHLLLEVAVLDHPGQLDRAPQVELAPLPPDVWLAQGGRQGAGLAPQQVGAVPHLVDLLSQLALPRGSLLLDVHQPLVEAVEPDAQDGLVLPARGQRPQHLGVAGTPRPGQHRRGTEQHADHQGQEGKHDVHVVRVAGGTDTTGDPGLSGVDLNAAEMDSRLSVQDT